MTTTGTTTMNAETFVPLFVAAAAAPTDDALVNAATDAYRLLPGGARGKSIAAGLTAAIVAGHAESAVALQDRVTAPAAKPAAPVRSDADIYSDRARALFGALYALPRPDGTDLYAALFGRPTDDADGDAWDAYRCASDALDTVHVTALNLRDDGIVAASERAIAAVSRGGSRGGTGTRGPVTVRRDVTATDGPAGAAHVAYVVGLIGTTVQDRAGNAVAVTDGVSATVVASIPSPIYPTTAPSKGAIDNAGRHPKTGAVRTGTGWRASVDGKTVRFHRA